MVESTDSFIILPAKLNFGTDNPPGSHAKMAVGDTKRKEKNVRRQRRSTICPVSHFDILSCLQYQEFSPVDGARESLGGL